MTRQIFISTACLPYREPVLTRIEAYHSQGLYEIELGANVSVIPDSINQLLDSKGSYLIHNYFPPPAVSFVLNLASGDVNVAQRSLDFVLAGLELTAQLKAPFYSIHAGFVTDPIGFGKTSYLFPEVKSPAQAQAAMRRFTAALETLLKRAGELDLMLIVENNVCPPDLRGSLLLQTADEFCALFDALPSRHLGILVDTGHLNVSAHTFGFDRISFIEQVASKIVAFHVHDNNGVSDLHQPVTPESWVVEILSRGIFQKHPIIVEARFDDSDNLRQHVDWLRGVTGE